MARSLIETMSGPWRPEDYADTYRETMEKIIEEKIRTQGADQPAPRAKKKKATSNVIDLVAVLRQSLAESGKGGAKSPAKKSKSAVPTKPAARKKKAPAKSAKPAASKRKAA